MGDRNLILFLDDSQERAAVAYQRMTERNRNRTIWARTAEEAITIIWDYRESLEIVTLDHDLGGETYVNVSSPYCGMEIVRFLEKTIENFPEEFEKLKEIQFIVHSWNEYAGPKMVRRLDKIGLNVTYKPFGI